MYAFMKYYEDTANAVYQEMSGRAQAAVTKLSEKYAFLTPEILAIDEKKMQEYLNSDTLALYRHALEDILVKKRPCPFRKGRTPACNGRAGDGFTE